VMRKGYRQRNRVIRYAEVAVNHSVSIGADAPADETIGDLRPGLQEDHLQQDGLIEGSEL
jgi:hypothetical protein